MAIVEFDQAGKASKVSFDAKRVHKVERSAKDASGSPITLVYLIGEARPFRVSKGYAATKTDLTTAGWGT